MKPLELKIQFSTEKLLLTQRANQPLEGNDGSSLRRGRVLRAEYVQRYRLHGPSYLRIDLAADASSGP
jgi:hypothetical protein